MKVYKVEIEHLTQNCAHIFVEAKNKREAIEIARKMEWEDFDEVEEVKMTQHRANRNWSLLDFLLGAW